MEGVYQNVCVCVRTKIPPTYRLRAITDSIIIDHYKNGVVVQVCEF